MPAADQAPVFLMIGRLLRDKGVTEFVDAARRIKSRHPTARFQLLGATDAQNRSAIDASTLQKWLNEGVVEYLGTTDDGLECPHMWFNGARRTWGMALQCPEGSSWPSTCPGGHSSHASAPAPLVVPLAVRLRAAQGWHGGPWRPLVLAPGTWWPASEAPPRSPSPWRDDAWLRLLTEA